MSSTTSLLDKLREDFATITFVQSDSFRWSPKEQTVYYEDLSNEASLLHEVAHHVLGHKEYTRDIELIQMERDAWHHTLSILSKRYNIKVTHDQVETMLDTYRDWLHDRSVCPKCEASGVQTNHNLYTCLACTSKWRVNEARSCALRRYKQK